MRAAAEGARMSLGFVEIEWGRLSSSRPVFCPGQRPPAARQSPPVDADRAARGRAIFPSAPPITKQVQIQNAQEPQDIMETSCAPLSLSLHVFTVFRSRTLHVFNHEKAREETAADVGNYTECGVMFQVRGFSFVLVSPVFMSTVHEMKYNFY